MGPVIRGHFEKTGPITYTFSKCPLITGTTETRKDKDSKSSIFYI